MNKITAMFAKGEISVEDLANASELMERARLVKKALQACQKTIVFSLGEREVECYNYTDGFGEYHSWGLCTKDGLFSCYSNWGGDHLIGQCHLTSATSVLLAFDQKEFEHDLMRFLEEQIAKAESMAE